MASLGVEVSGPEARGLAHFYTKTWSAPVYSWALRKQIHFLENRPMSFIQFLFPLETSHTGGYGPVAIALL